MAHFQNFRTALGGFNREDVVRYIEYMNNQHRSQIEQMNTQLQLAQAELANASKNDNTELLAKLEAAEARCAQLEAELAQTGNAQPLPQGDELEAYRRAERTERIARERAAQIYAQANAVLADATVKVDAAATQIGQIADQVSSQLQGYQFSINEGKALLQEAVAAMSAIRPEE